MEKLLQDILFGIRSLLKTPRFTIAAVLTLALGIGANTAMFSVIHSVLLKSWPFRDSSRLVVVSQRQANGNANLFSTQDFLNWKQQGLLARMGAHVSWEFNLSSAGTPPERVPGGEVSYDWLPILGVEPMLGRWFTAQEDVAGAGNFVVLSPTAYYPYAQVPDSMRSLIEANMGIAVRSRLAQRDLLHSIRMAVAAVSPEVPVYDEKTMESMVADSDSLRNFDLLLLGAFSFLALTLAAVGVYAVMAYSVSQRTREIGIRIALGARSRDVLRLILRQGARLAMTGSLIGVAGAFFLRKVMASLLYGLSANDPLILCLVPCVMVLVIMVACWLPARRATKIDPLAALHYE